MNNKFFVCGKEVFINLGNSQWTIIDLVDLPIISKYKVRWRAEIKNNLLCYAVTDRRIGKYRFYYKIHRILLGLKINDPREPDHKNRNGLDNRRDNLRIVTRSLNNFNQGLAKNNKSGVKGVFYIKARRRWWAYVEIDGKRRNLGYHKLKEDAIEARSKAEDALIL